MAKKVDKNYVKDITPPEMQKAVAPLVLPQTEMSVVADAQQKKEADARNMIAYGTTNPSQSQILQRAYGLQHGDKTSIEASKEINPLAEAQAQVPTAMNAQVVQQQQAQAQDLAQRQQAELQQIDLLKNNQKPLTTYERNVQAGEAFVSSLGANVGLSTENQNPTPQVLKPLFAATGVIATTNIAGVSLSSLFSPASGNIKQLQGDIADNVAESKRITSAAISRGANLQQAISSLNLLEESTRFKYNAAAVSLRESPKDVREGLDLMDEMSRNLRIMTENRQLLERYALTGDPKDVLLWQGEGSQEEQ